MSASEIGRLHFILVAFVAKLRSPGTHIGCPAGLKRFEIERPVEIGERHCGKQRARIGMNRLPQQDFARRKFDNATAAHDSDTVGHVVHHCQIVRYKKIS